MFCGENFSQKVFPTPLSKTFKTSVLRLGLASEAQDAVILYFIKWGEGVKNPFQGFGDSVPIYNIILGSVYRIVKLRF